MIVFCRLIAVPARARPEISAAAVKGQPVPGHRRHSGEQEQRVEHGARRGGQRGQRRKQSCVACRHPAHRRDAQALAVRTAARDDAQSSADELHNGQGGCGRGGRHVTGVVQEEDDEPEHGGLGADQQRAARAQSP
jgi:hypothetical protein